MTFRFRSLATAGLLALAVAAPQPSYALTDKEKAQLAGAVLAIAIAKKVHDKRKEDKARGEPYQAAKDITCFPEMRKCYWHSRYSPRWTHHEFG